MLRTVELPLWLFVLILLFAAVTFASHFLFPSVRWFFRRRMERVVVELNKRLDRPIVPFKLAQRHDTIQRLIYDRDVLNAVSELARAESIPEAVAHERARRYAREIVPSFSASTYFGFATRFTRWLSTSLYRVRITHLDDALGRIPRDSTVIFVMNHRSNMDYVLVTYLVAERGALSYAVGEWARVWPLSSLIRAMGAYFIRRKRAGMLYRRVLARYVAMATEAGVSQAVFPEGGLSLDGRLQAPKLGILSYVLDGAAGGSRDIVFVPVALNYDRVLEDRILTAAGRAGDRRFRASIPQAFAAVAGFLWLRLRGRFRRFGTAGVGFGAPLSLADFLEEPHNDPAAELAQALMDRVAEFVPVLPVPLVAAELLAAPGPLGRDALETRIAARLVAMGEGAWAALAVREAVPLLLMRRLAAEGAEGVSATAEGRDLLAYYAASIAHLPRAPAALLPEEKAPPEAVET
jgi:glycerol-3-phosphate O-acyltransferase